MNKKNIIGITFIYLIIILSSVQIISAEDTDNLRQNFINFTDFLKEYENVDINKFRETTWYPGFLITLLLAPFIILYIIIAIILDIGNP